MCGSVFALPTFVAASASVRATDGTVGPLTTTAINCTGANFYAVAVAYERSHTPTVSDNDGTTYTPSIASYSQFTSAATNIYWAAARTGKSSVTFTVSSQYHVVIGACFGHTSTLTLDASLGPNANCGGCQPNNSTNADNELVLSTATGISASFSVSGLTTIATVGYNENQNFSLGFGYSIAGSSGQFYAPYWSDMTDGGATLSFFQPGEATAPTSSAVRRRIL